MDTIVPPPADKAEQARGEYHYGYDIDAHELILWRRGRRMPVARIPFADGVTMASTVLNIIAASGRVS